METISCIERKSLLDLIETIVASSRRFPISTQKIIQAVSREDNSRRRHLIEAQLQILVEEGKLLFLSDSMDSEYFHEKNLRRLQHRILDRLDCYHHANPSSPGLSRSEIRLSLSEDKTRNHQRIIDGRILDIVINRAIREHDIVLVGENYSKVGFCPVDVKTDMAAVKKTEIYRKLFNLFNNQNPGVNSPERLETRLRMKKREIIETINLLLKENEIVRLEKNRYISMKVVDSIKLKVSAYLAKHPGMYITDLADHLGMSRKSLSPVLDYLDRTGFTIRKGDYRYLAQPQPFEFSIHRTQSLMRSERRSRMERVVPHDE